MTRWFVVLSVVVLGAAACVSVRPAPSSKPVAAAPAPAGGAAAASAPKAPPPAAATPIASGDTTPLPAQATIGVPTDSSEIQAIVDEGGDDTHVAADLAYLSDVIGPRLTGSSALRQANEWTRTKFLAYGVDSAWTEAWKFGRGWQRGPMVVELVAPHRQELMGASWAWTPGTNGPATGNVEFIDPSSADDFAARYAGKLRGAWVMTRPPGWVHNADFGPMTHEDSLQLDSVLRAGRTMTDAQRKFRHDLPALVAREGALGILTDGSKEFALLTMSGSPLDPFPLANIVLPHETYAMFARLRHDGVTVTLRADITNTLTVDTLFALNTVAEIRGTEHPEQVVLLGAHLDSWDLGSGTTDNGAGAIAVLEAARILAAAKVRPARTIRFALFTGEEEGLMGSAAYARAHAADLANYQAVLVIDNGTGRITGIALQGRRELHDAWASMLTPLSALGPFSIRSANKGGTDHLSFLPYGVPGFNYDQATSGYNHTHHSQVDTYDHAIPADIEQAATVMAVNAYQWASADTLLARGAIQ
jgi:carboxypeptidase Q